MQPLKNSASGFEPSGAWSAKSSFVNHRYCAPLKQFKLDKMTRIN